MAGSRTVDSRAFVQNHLEISAQRSAWRAVSWGHVGCSTGFVSSPVPTLRKLAAICHFITQLAQGVVDTLLWAGEGCHSSEPWPHSLAIC